uniref:sigma factor n=1 Tax=Gudongella sp. SC589 TaxID=3385990 RepID=UPI0039047390
MRITEDNFIQEIKKRNEKALEYVIENYGWILKTVLKKHLFYLQDYYDECMNDCLLAVWENINNYNPEKSNFKNWVGGIAKYKSIDYTRKYLKD